VKDLGLVMDAARDAEFQTPLASTAHQLFAAAAAAGLGRADDSAVIKVYAGINSATSAGTPAPPPAAR
jgi:putative dehydrogenase